MRESSSASAQVIMHGPMRDLIKKIQDLPVIPPVGVRAMTLSLSDDVDLNNLGRVVESDPVLSANILRLVNNVSCGLRDKVGSVKQAITLAGLNQVRCALLGVMLKDSLGAQSQNTARDARYIWSHSLLSAIIARNISRRTYPELKESAFVAALLHDIGKIVIMDIFPDSHELIRERKIKNNLSSIEAEQQILDTNHCLAGKVLASHWGLPQFIVDCAWLHHNPVESGRFLSASKELLDIVTLSNLAAHDVFCEEQAPGQYDSTYKTLLSKMELTEKDAQKVGKEAMKEYGIQSGFFDLDGDFNNVFQDVIQKANKKLSQLGLEIEKKNKFLFESNQILELENILHKNLTPIVEKESFFQAVSDSFSHFQPARAGFFYTIDNETRELEGIIWMDGGRKRNLLCFLDRDGLPVWEHDDASLAAELKNMILNYRNRRCPEGGLSYNVNSRFHIVSFHGGNGFFGELCIFLRKEFSASYRHNRAALTNISRIICSHLDRIALYNRLEKRTEELSQTLWKNRQMNLKLIQAERLGAVGQLAAGAAHEINNPLAIISARSQLLQLKEKDEKRKRELELISDQIDRISKILSNLMDFARPAPPSLQDADLHSVIDKVLELVENGYKKQGMSIEKKYSSDLVSIKADPNQLEQVFLNLFINAQHAMEKSGGKLTITTSLSQDKKNVSVRVEDQGEGISRENLKKIFDPFFTTKEEGKGTGLGLSTACGIINSHFGKLDITSQPGNGTQVSIELPVDIADLRPAFSDTRGIFSRSDRKARPRILVVDDEEHIRDILRETLENEDMVVETADNGQDGLEKCVDQDFDLLLLDIKMPARDGLSLLREIRKADESLPVIIITGMASHEEMQEAIGHGNCKCVRKPFHIKTLLALIKESLEK
ncbi:MAG: HDOD domain-containing protein [Desulfonatronovibrio sp.]